MIKSRLIEVIKTFSNKEFRELKKWLASPAHNQREDVVLLFDYLSKKENLNKENYLTKEAAFKVIYHKEKFDDAKMRQVMHFLFKNIEDFLLFSEFSADKLTTTLTLAKIYRSRKLDRSFLKTKKDIEQILQPKDYQSEDLSFKKYLFQKELYEFQSVIKRSQDLNLQELTDTFDEVYLSEKLRHGCLINAHKRVYKVEYSEGLLKEILTYIESNNLQNNPRIGIYFYLYKITSDFSNEDDFFILKEYLLTSKSFTKTELKEIYLFAINFCISKINQNNKAFIEESYLLYKEGIESNIFIDNNTLSRWTFNNALTTGFSLKKYEWAEDFINKFSKYLKPEYRENYVQYNMARLYFNTKKYEKSMVLVSQYEFKDILVNLSAKTMLLKMYCEQSEFRVLESLLESMRAYIQRKKVLGYHKSNYKNIIRYTKKLLKVNPYSKAQKEKLKAEIETAKPLTEKAWLLKQLSEL